eukprot:3289723-Amphidinium_carterae.1
MEPTRQAWVRLDSAAVDNLIVERRSILMTDLTAVQCKLVKAERLSRFTCDTLLDYCREQGDVRCRAAPLLPTGTSIKVVGLVLNTSFTFAPHVAAALSVHFKACQLLRRLHNCSFGPPRHVLSALATTAVQSKVLMHAGVVMPLLSQTQRQKLERLDGKLACLVAHLPKGTPYAAAICEAGLLPLSVRARQQQLRHLALSSMAGAENRLAHVLRRPTERVAQHLGLGWCADFHHQLQ